MKACVLLNAAAGSLHSGETSDHQRIERAFAKAGAHAVVSAVEPGDMAGAVREANDSDADAVVLGGGDGTLSGAVSAFLDGGKPLGILPYGTLNHFARDLGIPLGLEEAVRTIVAGHVRRVDVGEVGGRFFLNNASIGIYPEVVRSREDIQADGSGSKRRATLRAAVAQLRRFPLVTVTLRLPARSLRVTTPMVFVGNNRYEMKLLAPGRRSDLDRGELWLYVARAQDRFGFVRFVARALLGRLDADRDFQSELVPELEVATSWRRSLRVALDGEVARLRTPLRFLIRPRALSVLAPPAAT